MGRSPSAPMSLADNTDDGKKGCPNKFSSINPQTSNPCSLFQNDFGRALAEDVKSLPVLAWHNGAHRLADRVERVHFDDFLFWHRRTNLVVILPQINNEAEQSALRLVSDLLRQLILRLRHLNFHTVQPDK